MASLKKLFSVFMLVGTVAATASLAAKPALSQSLVIDDSSTPSGTVALPAPAIGPTTVTSATQTIADDTPADRTLSISLDAGGFSPNGTDTSVDGTQTTISTGSVSPAANRPVTFTFNYDFTSPVDFSTLPILEYDIVGQDEGSPQGATPSLTFQFTFGDGTNTSSVGGNVPGFRFDRDADPTNPELCGGAGTACTQSFDISGVSGVNLNAITSLVITVDAGSAVDITFTEVRAVPWNISSSLFATMQGAWILGLGSLWYRKRSRKLQSEMLS